MNVKDLLKDAYKEGMTAEEIVKALEGISMPDNGAAEIERLRSALSKSNSEAADYKKQLREKMSTDEVKAKEEADRLKDLQDRYDALLRESTIAKYKAALLSLGYEDGVASQAAEAIADGDSLKMFELQKKHQDARDKSIREEALKSTPRATGGAEKPKTAEDIMKISDIAERQSAIAENIELFE